MNDFSSSLRSRKEISQGGWVRILFNDYPVRILTDVSGNPTLLGLIGLLIPFQTTMWCLVQFKGADSTSLVAVSGPLYFMGGIAMNIAGIAEFILGNTFPFAVFIIYGCYWVSLAYTGDPSHLLLSAYGAEGAVSKPWNSAQGNFSLVMAMASFIFLLGSLRTNIPNVVLFFTLIILYGFIAAADWQVAFNPTPEGLASAASLLRIGGGFGFVTAIMGW
jgi:succinate-acetate transporter protein